MDNDRYLTPFRARYGHFQHERAPHSRYAEVCQPHLAPAKLARDAGPTQASLCHLDKLLRRPSRPLQRSLGLAGCARRATVLRQEYTKAAGCELGPRSRPDGPDREQFVLANCADIGLICGRLHYSLPQVQVTSIRPSVHRLRDQFRIRIKRSADPSPTKHGRSAPFSLFAPLLQTALPKHR